MDASPLSRPTIATTSRRARVPNALLVAAASRRQRVTALSVVLSGDEPPTEFRIFTSGQVETTKGTFTFDDAAALSVMADYTAHGIDLMIDYDHASLASVTLDPAQTGKAAGWFNLEVRGGELWAINVRWTEPAAEALKRREWRFMSPAFQTDDAGHITSVLNVAITNIPATRKLEPLMAASARDLRTLSTGTSFDAVRMALDAALCALFPVDPATCMPSLWIADVFDASVVYELDGKLYEAPYTYDGTKASLGAAAEVVRTYAPAAPAATAANKLTAMLAAGGTGMDPKLIKEALDALIADDAAKCQEILKGLVASAAGAPADAPADGEPKPDPKLGAGTEEEKPEEVMAASARLMRLSGKKTFVASVADVEVWHASHLKLEIETQKLADERKIFEAAKRRELCRKLVTSAGKAPATVWATPDAGSAPKAYLLAMSIPDLEQMVADEVAAKGGKSTPIVPAAGDITTASGGKDIALPDGRVVTLSARELAVCTEMKVDPKDYAARKPVKKD